MKSFISIIIPTKNNADLIGTCLDSIKALDYPQNRIEIIVSDGLSTDRTREIAESYDAKVVLDYGKSVVTGRNAAFAVAKGELIAISDADCTVHQDWLKNSLKYFNDPTVGGVGGPNLIPNNETAFGKAVGLIFAWAPYITKAAHTRILDKVIESRSHGSNAIYRADVLNKVTPVDESLVGGEDVIMNDEIEDLGYKLLYVPDVIVNHYRRPNPRRWWHQMYRYGMGRVLLPRHRKGEVHPVHVLAGLSVPILIALTLLLGRLEPWLLVGLVSLLALGTLFSAGLAALATRSIRVGFNMPLVLFIFFTAWSFGFIHEFFIPTRVLQKEQAKV
jgi:cellulose synthase/poly-beta-1,6-N-acetylglucosamine synthase-like glycosyltransferase